jgi:hypothetical protein
MTAILSGSARPTNAAGASGAQAAGASVAAAAGASVAGAAGASVGAAAGAQAASKNVPTSKTVNSLFIFFFLLIQNRFVRGSAPKSPRVFIEIMICNWYYYINIFFIAVPPQNIS